ncbi:MAG: hypothetical protein OHK0022_55000 [Roseiflexaceae bacterium]
MMREPIVSEERIPSLVLREVCESVIDNLGEKNLRLLFTQAGLQGLYQGELPPADDTPSISVGEFSQLFAATHRIFGARGMKPILLRSGRTSAEHFRQTNKTLMALTGAAFKVLPTDAKIKLMLSRAAKLGEEMLHTPHRFYDTPEAYVIEISACPYCAGSHAEHGICFFPVGFYGDMLRWATGTAYTINETECIATGGAVCRFEIGRVPRA